MAAAASRPEQLQGTAVPDAPGRAAGRSAVAPETVLRTARRVFLATGSLEMRAFARELGISRATLYRWCHGRDELLSEVFLSLARANLARVEGEILTPPGALRVCEVHDLHIRRISESPSMRTFCRCEPEAASRLLLDANGSVHLGVTELLADFLRRQEELSDWRAPLGVETFARVVSRMSEAYIYADLIARDEPETDTPNLMLRLMLGLPIEG